MTNNPTSKDKMMDRIRRFDVHRRERECVFHEQRKHLQKVPLQQKVWKTFAQRHKSQ